MKRYLLFVGPVYYPGGGWCDFKATSDSIDELRELAKKTGAYDWWHIIDTTTMEEVENG